ncbi:hypothetical protein ACLMAJ_34130 [Nocardia sp. KC 131]|uniref:hypothetical protein n=1 Tax=Nocardia arseniciresistens TaxID=3392119 RepID=UPI00398F2EAA
MIRDRRARRQRACRPRQAARLVRGTWRVDDRWAGVAMVPRSAAAESLRDVAHDAAPTVSSVPAPEQASTDDPRGAQSA